jgi:preprotein translocase subunit Sec61beta
MTARQEKVSMPMTSAGIIGFSPDIKISGKEIEPKFLIAAIVVLVIVVHIASYMTR